MERARESEAQYFRQRREYDAVSACCGVGVLAERLNKVLAKSIRDSLPSVRQALEKALDKKKRESRMYGEVRGSACSGLACSRSAGRSVAFGGVRWRSRRRLP